MTCPTTSDRQRETKYVIRFTGDKLYWNPYQMYTRVMRLKTALRFSSATEAEIRAISEGLTNY